MLGRRTQARCLMAGATALLSVEAVYTDGAAPVELLGLDHSSPMVANCNQ